jgi:PadR family transcriptional regulator PadR
VTGEGTLYPLLSRLKKGGHVVTTWRDSDAGPPRKYDAITAEGRRGRGTSRRRRIPVLDRRAPIHGRRPVATNCRTVRRR